MSWAIQTTPVTPPETAAVRQALSTIVPSAATTSVADLQGEYYIQFLTRMHAALRPKTYLEIGTFTGESLAVANCASISVDPDFRAESGRIGTKPFCGFYQMTSDDFFAAHSPTAIFGRPVDIAFLDGLHWAEALLRDFINTERHCRSNSVVVLHDCVPVDVHITDRDGGSGLQKRGTRPDWWTGDVWKILPILRRLRPDLSIHVLDASPTGLALITNLDPANTILETNYAACLRDIRELDLERHGIRRFIDEQDIGHTADYRTDADFAARFWL